MKDDHIRFAMAQKTRISKSTTQASSPTEIPIVRDTTFVRIGADDVVPVGRRRDYQLSFLARGQELKAFGERQKSDTPGATGAQPVLVGGAVYELARVTVPHSQAFTMAMRIIDNELEDGRRSVEFVRLAVEGLLKQYEGKQSAGSPDSGDEDDQS